MAVIINGKILRNVPGKSEGIDTPVLKINGQELEPGSTLYRHHFDVIIAHTDLAALPENAVVAINVNALSTSGDPWIHLSELDGKGYIITAFGTQILPTPSTNYVVELKLYYDALGILLIDLRDLTTNTISTYAISTVSNGILPIAYEINDSVTKL